MNTLRICLLTIAILCCGAADGCKGPEKRPDAAPTAKGAASPLPGAIAKTGTNTAAAMAASEARNAATERLASKAAVLSGQAEEARKLYAGAATAADAAKAEVARLTATATDARAKAEAALAALAEADRRWEAALKANESANQAKLDAAEARAKKAQDDLLDVERSKDALWLRIAGIGLLLAGIGIGAFTNGLQLGKSIGFGVGAAACFALAQIVAHPWFLRVSIGCLVLSAGAAIWWFMNERKNAVARDGYEKTIATIDHHRDVLFKADGTKTSLALDLEDVLDKPHKLLVEKFQTANAIKAVKQGA